MRINRLPTHLSALALALLLALSGCGKSPEQHLADGKAFFQKADYKAAVIELKSVLQERPTDMEARLLLAQSHYQLEAYADAQKELQRAKQLGASDDQILGLLAMSLLRSGEYESVFKLTLPQSGLSPTTLAMLHTARATAFIVTGRRQQAQADLLAAQQANPTLPSLLLLQANLAILDQDPTTARQKVEAVLQADPQHKESLYLKAAMLQQQNKLDEASQQYRQLLAHHPEEYRAHLAIANIQLARDLSQEAEKSLQAAEKIAGTNLEVRYARGIFELRRGKLAEASSALLDVLRVVPNHLPSSMAYALASYGQGQYEQSLRYAKSVLAVLPGNVLASKVLAGSQIKLGDAQEALKTLQPLLTRYPNDAKTLALAGEAYLGLKDYNQAMGYLDRAAAIDPENTTISTRQAAGHLASGDNRRAIADLEKLVARSPQASQADLALVMLYLQNHEYNQALQTLQVLEKKLPSNPITYNLRAAALLGLQDTQGARKALEQALTIQPTFMTAALNLARLDMAEKKPEAARKRFLNVLTKDKNNVKAMQALADLALAAKKEDEYVDWLGKAIKVAPQDLTSHQLLINHWLAKKDHAKALAQARQAANANPENPAALNLLASTQLAGKETAAAVETYKRLLLKSPQSPEVMLLMAQAQEANKQFATARRTLQEALDLKPNFLPALEAMAKLDLQDNKPEDALAIARKIQAQHSKSPIGFDREGDIQLVLKRYAAAVKAYEQAYALAPNTVTIMKLHRALSLAGNDKLAEQRLQAWLKQHPEDETARNYAAEIFMLTKRPREAIAQYELLLKQRPNSALILNNLANLYYDVQDPRALATAEQAYKLAPDQPSVMDTLGWLLVEQKQMERARDLLAKAAVRVPNNPVIRYHYGVALMLSGKPEEARRELAAALSHDKQFPGSEHARALLKDL